MFIVGHRGAAGEAPENTVAGCLHAIERGVRHIEIDLRLSSDDQLVVLHDKSVDRTTATKGLVRSFRADQLAAMDARQDGPPWPRKKHCGVPTLDTLIKATPKLKGYQLEVKSESTAVINQIAQLLAQRFPTAASARKITVTSSNLSLHKELKALAPHIKRGLVAGNEKAMEKFDSLDCSLCAMHWEICTPKLVRKLRKARIHTSVWTVNDASKIIALYRMGVDSVISNYPSMAIPLLASLQRG